MGALHHQADPSVSFSFGNKKARISLYRLSKYWCLKADKSDRIRFARLYASRRGNARAALINRTGAPSSPTHVAVVILQKTKSPAIARLFVRISGAQRRTNLTGLDLHGCKPPGGAKRGMALINRTGAPRSSTRVAVVILQKTKSPAIARLFVRRSGAQRQSHFLLQALGHLMKSESPPVC